MSALRKVALVTGAGTGIGKCTACGGLHGKPALGCERAIYDHPGDPDALHRARVT